MSKILIIGSIPFSLINFRKPLLVHLREAGHEVYAAAGGDDPETAQELRDAGIQYLPTRVERNSYGILGALKSIYSLYRVIKNVGPDIVVLYTIQPVLFGSLMAWFAGVPRIYSMITGVGALFIHQTWKTRLMRLLIWPLYRIALSRNEKIIFQNKHDRKDLIAWRLMKESTPYGMVPSSGVDRSIYTPTPLPPKDKISFLYSARFIREKGITEFLKAGHILRKQGLDFDINIVGGDLGESTRVPDDELDALVQKAGATRFGWTKDVRENISNSHVFVLPTYREGAPRSVLEAMSMGRAIITTSTPGAQDVVEENVNAILVPPRDADAVAQAMRKFIEQPELVDQFAGESVRIVEEVHCAETVAAITVSLMDVGGESPPKSGQAAPRVSIDESVPGSAA